MVCLLCCCTLSIESGNNSNLKRHLKLKHKVELELYIEEQRTRRAEEKDTTTVLEQTAHGSERREENSSDPLNSFYDIDFTKIPAIVDNRRFKFLRVEPNGKMEVACLLCCDHERVTLRIVTGNNSNLKRHLNTKHKVEYELYVGEQKNKRAKIILDSIKELEEKASSYGLNHNLQ